jgi:hypothetical protein
VSCRVRCCVSCRVVCAAGCDRVRGGRESSDHGRQVAARRGASAAGRRAGGGAQQDRPGLVPGAAEGGDGHAPRRPQLHRRTRRARLPRRARRPRAHAPHQHRTLLLQPRHDPPLVAPTTYHDLSLRSARVVSCANTTHTHTRQFGCRSSA